MELRLHGANPLKLYREFNITPPCNVIDFSTNTNILDFNVDLNINIKDLISEYPDDDCVEVRELIASANNISINNILMGNGSNEIIYLLASTLQNKKVAILSPTYIEYSRALNAHNISYDLIFDINDAKQYDVCFICNPNNPTGYYYDSSILEELLDQGVTLVIDEAYKDFLIVDYKGIDLSKYSNVYILRSLTKTYHLSGVRIGYVISNATNITELKKRQPTWSVNAIALELTKRYLSEPKYLVEMKEYFSTETVRVISKLRALGLQITNTTVNFYLVKVKDDISLIKALLYKGIVVRHTRNFKSLDGKYVRISVKSIEDNNYLIKCLEELVNENIYF